MAFGRFLMRLLLVPLGGCIALVVAMMFVMVAHLNRIEAAAPDDPSGLLTLLTAPMLALSVAYMMLPSILAVLIAEAFAIRSWMYHAAAGGLSALVSLATIGAFDKTYDLSDDPLIATGAGIVAGFAYWLVAGWSAGFWKPVFAQPRPNALPLA
jgi:glucan phosphoethanolaminetransferase (alkaline phosphatase superfamily)